VPRQAGAIGFTPVDIVRFVWYIRALKLKGGRFASRLLHQF
jgi:hypothetical protein